jgi:hypothetical protein
MLWKRAYETKISDGHLQAIGRGSTPEAAQETAERNWVAETQVEYEASRALRPEAPSRRKI